MYFDTLFPTYVACEEVTDFENLDPLHPAEGTLVRRWAPRRVRHFMAGRHCARRALGRLGCVDIPLPVSACGMPEWPSGIVGSITHCDHFAAACISRSQSVLAIGIDAEPAVPLPRGTADILLTENERSWIASNCSDTPWGTVHFCAKEAFFKAWFSTEFQYVELRDIEVTIDPVAQRYRVTVPSLRRRSFMTATATSMIGKFDLVDGWVLAIAYLPCDAVGKGSYPCHVQTSVSASVCSKTRLSQCFDFFEKT